MRLRYTFAFFVLLICYAPVFAMFFPKTNFGPGIPDIGPIRLLSYLAILSFLLEVSVKRVRVKLNKWLLIIFLFSLVVALSVSWSKNYTYNSSTIQGLFNSVLLPLLIACISVTLFSDKETIDCYVKHIGIAGPVLGTISVVQFALKLSMVHGQLRSVATLANPNTLAIFLVLIIPTLLYAIEKKIFRPPLGWILLLTVFGGILCTVSRKGTITAMLAFVLYSFLRKNWKLLGVSIFLGLFCTLIVLENKSMIQRFSCAKFKHDTMGKMAMARAGLDMFKKHPILGLGYKGYYENFGKYFPFSYHRRYDAHNEYVTALANYGMVGFIPFIFIFFYPLLVALRNLRKTGTGGDMSVLGICTVIPFMVNIGFAGTAFYQPVLTFLFYTHTSFVFVDQDEQA